MTITEKAHAKINLTLEILGTRRGDGFHDIASVMVKVPDLYDTLTFSVSDLPENAGKITFSCDKAVCEPEKNLAYRAAHAYYDAADKPEKALPGVFIDLKKSIPAGAGLAGGSADAAAVLNALNALFGALSAQTMFDLALSLGSDVPFCLADCETALCTGRGEKIEPLAPLHKVRMEVRFPKTPLSTAGIYAEYDRFYTDDYTKDKSLWLAKAINKHAPLEELMPYFCNDFQALCEKRCPEIAALCRKLEGEGAFAQMTGSGSAVFGLWKV